LGENPELRYSIFVVPKDTLIEGKGKVRGAVKGRKRNRVLVLNRVAQSIIEARRGKHPTHVFAYRKHPIQTMSNTAWQDGRREAGKEDPYLADLRVHDLRHTVGMRLREANERENIIADVLWHEHSGMTSTTRSRRSTSWPPPSNSSRTSTAGRTRRCRCCSWKRRNRWWREQSP
jgi:integrase